MCVSAVELPDHSVPDEAAVAGGTLILERRHGALGKPEVEQAGPAVSVQGGLVEDREPALVVLGGSVPLEFIGGLVEKVEAQPGFTEPGMVREPRSSR